MPSIWITPLNRSEFAHAVYRQVFIGLLNLGEANRVSSVFEDHTARGMWIPASLPDSVWRTSIDLARRHGHTLAIRTLDSLHVACALELGAERFWTFDVRQERLAQAAGLNTNP
jgi:predicted nucleic acid-binding protein